MVQASMMTVPMAVNIVNNHKNGLKRNAPASSAYYQNLEERKIPEMPDDENEDNDENDKSSSSRFLHLEVANMISKEESRLLEELTINFNNNKPVLGRFPKSSSFDSTTALAAQKQSPNSKKAFVKQKLNGFKQDNNTSSGKFKESHTTCLNESESDNEYTLMLGNNYSTSLKTITSSREGDLNDYNQEEMSNLQMNCNLLSCSNHSLVNGTTPLLNGSSPGNGSYVTLRKGPRSLARARTTCCFRLHTYFTRNSYLNYLVPLLVLIAFLAGAYLTKDYAKRLFYWVETQNSWIIFGLFMAFFILVSFPIIVGYFALIVTAGYLFGCLRGILTVVLGANLGIAIAHFTIRSLRRFFPTQKLIKNETARAILRVISGPRAFKVVLFTRLTPIPFGLQNAIFGISTINTRVYHVATFVGLLPAQTINVYLGSTLRSMQEVLSNNGTSVMGYISIGFEIICGAALMCWVVQKAKKELSETLISDLNENKDIDIDIQV